MIIEPVRNYVVISFVEEIANDRFVNSTSGQIILTSDDRSQTTYPRWAKIESVGPDVTSEVEVGKYALVESGKWTSHFHVNGDRYWKTDDDMIIAVADEPGTTY